MFGLILTGVAAVSASAYIYNLYICPPSHTRKITVDFKTIGVVKQIFIYPLDGGPEHEVNSARCTKTGLRVSDKRALQDRSYIAYWERNRTAMLNVLNPELVTKNIDNLLSEITEQKPSTKRRRVKINYLGETMTVIDQGRDIANTAVQVFGNMVKDIRIGYCSPKYREKYNDNRVEHPDWKTKQVVDKYSSYFSSYTLVNHSSLRYLKQQTGAKVSPSNFRANIVIDGPEFCEDSIFSLKIGDTLFYDTQPCSHSPSAFISERNIANPEDLQPYKYLKQNRSQSDVRAELGNFEFPTFGINMTLVATRQENIIRVGDPVVATMYYYEQ